MTITTKDNTVVYNGDGVNLVFPFLFKIIENDDLQVFVDNVLVEENDPTYPHTITGAGDDAGGDVTFTLTAPPSGGANVLLARIIPVTQEVDYTPYDDFPADTHEGALDKLTMIAQQNAETATRSVRLPLGDTANVVYPPLSERAEKFAYFDAEGNVTVVDAELAAPAVLRVDIQDGTGGEDSRSLLHSEVVTGGPNFPKIGFININKASGPLQLDAQGKVPFANLNIAGIQLLGPFRGDDLCDKPGDSVGDCTVPDARNPSERFPELVPVDPSDTGKYATGDTHILIFEDPEVNGTMNLFSEVGDVAPSVVSVKLRDGIMFMTGWDRDGVDLPGVEQGWYHIPQLADTGDASFIAYDSTGNIYALGTNVQVAIDAVDSVLVAKDAYYLSQQNANRLALSVTAGDLNAIAGTGFYNALATDANVPTSDEYGVIHNQVTATFAVQIAQQSTDGSQIYVRSYTTTWSNWTLLGTNDGVVAAQVAADTAQVAADAAQVAADAAQGDADQALLDAAAANTNADTRKPGQDFLRTGDRLDIFNVRTS